MKHSKKGKSVMVFAGLGVLILLVCIAGWLTVRMLDLNEGLDQLAGTGGSGTPPSDTSPQSAPAVVVKKIPLPENTAPAAVPSAAPQPQVAPTALRQPTTDAAETDVKRPDGPEKPTETPQPDSTPPEIQTAQSPEPMPTSKGADIEAPGPSPPATESEPEATGPSAEPEPEPTEFFSIQVGAFESKEYALERAGILKALGYDPHIFTGPNPHGQTWHTVRIGKFETVEKAREVESSFKQESDFPTVIVQVVSLQPASTGN